MIGAGAVAYQIDNFDHKFEVYYENYYALIISICTDKNATQALSDMGLNDGKYVYNGGNSGRETAIDELSLRRCYNSGMTSVEMAEKFECCQTTIYAMIKRYGIKKNRQNRRGD